MLFDTHCHLDREELSQDIDSVLDEAELSGVSHLLVPGCGVFNWDRVEKLSECQQNIYFALGLHPYFLDKHRDDDIEELERRLKFGKSKCVAIGECGLDFYHSRESELQQKALLISQIKLANAYELPLILHCRKAHQELIKVLKQHPLKNSGVIHGFTGSAHQAQEFIKLGLYIGVGGSITYERANKTRNAIASIPLSSIVLETDAPDMPVSGYQGTPNYPKHIKEILKSLILLRKECEQTVASMVFVNSKRLFRICE
ncbi:TatD family hydrolase [Vibrio hannami]